MGHIGINGAKPVFADPNADNLVAKVSTPVPVEYNPDGDIKIAVIDCGVKQNILRCLVKRGAHVMVLPYNYDFLKDADAFDGLFISNGPGSPTTCPETIANLRKAIDTFNKPIFGICMGNLLLGMAAGLDTYKLPFGNRGHNQPALHVQTGQCSITSQNHGYALNDKSMPKGWKKLFVNANDGSNEAFAMKHFLSFQCNSILKLKVVHKTLNISSKNLLTLCVKPKASKPKQL